VEAVIFLFFKNALSVKTRVGVIMAKDFLTDEQVEKEIEKLVNSPLVKLARKEERIRYRRRQYLYSLRNYEKKGRELQNAGITMEILNGLENDIPSESEN
jgi:hypothetical protein